MSDPEKDGSTDWTGGRCHCFIKGDPLLSRGWGEAASGSVNSYMESTASDELAQAGLLPNISTDLGGRKYLRSFFFVPQAKKGEKGKKRANLTSGPYIPF